MPQRTPLDVAGAAEVLGVSVGTIRRLVLERRIPFHRVARCIRFDPDELDRWFAATLVAPIPTRTRRKAS